MTDITHQTKPSSEYMALPPEERELLRKHFSRLGRKGGKSVPHDKRVRAGKLGAAARMQSLVKRLNAASRTLSEINQERAKASSSHSETDIVDNY